MSTETNQLTTADTTATTDPLIAQLTALLESFEAKRAKEAKAREIPADVPRFVSW